MERNATRQNSSFFSQIRPAARLRYSALVPAKRRVDLLLVERGLVPSRTQAQALILAGKVFTAEQRVEKAGTELDVTAALSVREGDRFASRGGYKLLGALEALHCDVAGATCADVGASTGGFTDCLLQLGARKIYAIDVGHGQLAHKLVSDPRVVVMDRTNARHVERQQFQDPLDLVVVDASFISLEKLLPAITSWLAPGARLLAMVKPQFEVWRDEARRQRGVIRDAAVRGAAIERALESIRASGFEVRGGVDSTVPGPKGNVEYFVLAERT
jgi:23S rRNA (cytidine1920-2'-O)/16S rRNA (cytidine1409-2'-O)-methyltransferase